MDHVVRRVLASDLLEAGQGAVTHEGVTGNNRTFGVARRAEKLTGCVRKSAAG
jgi:hypothetical protein